MDFKKGVRDKGLMAFYMAFEDYAKKHYASDDRMLPGPSREEVFRENYMLLSKMVPHMLEGEQKYYMEYSFGNKQYLTVEPLDAGLLSFSRYFRSGGDVVDAPSFLINIDNSQKMARVFLYTTETLCGQFHVDFSYEGVRDFATYTPTELFVNDLLTDMLNQNICYIMSPDIQKLAYDGDGEHPR